MSASEYAFMAGGIFVAFSTIMLVVVTVVHFIDPVVPPPWSLEFGRLLLGVAGIATTYVFIIDIAGRLFGGPDWFSTL